MASDWKQHRSVLELLDQFYCWKSTLREYLEYVFLLNNVDEKSRKAIFNDDSNGFKKLLNDTIICCGCDVDVIPVALKLFDTFCYQHELVKRVIEVNCRKKKEAEHVLSRGFSTCKHDSKRERLPDSFGIQIDHPNTITSYICSEIWKDLCARIGCDLMLHILQNMSLFHKMERNNLYQVTGTIVDKSKVKDRNHICNGQFLDFVQKLSHLNTRPLSFQSQESLQKNSEATVSIDTLDSAHCINQCDEAPSTPVYGTGPVLQKVRTSTPTDDLPKLTNSSNAAASPFGEDISLLGPEFRVKISRKRVCEIRWFWNALTEDSDEVVDSEESSEDGSTFSCDFPLLRSKRQSRDNSGDTKKMYNSESDSCITQQPPIKKKWRMEESHVGRTNRTSYVGTEECKIIAIVKNGIPSWSSKDEIIANENYNEEENAVGLGESPGIAFSTPKGRYRASSWRTKEGHNSEAHSCMTEQHPRKRKRRKEKEKVEMTSRTNMCYFKTEEYRKCSNVSNKFPSKPSKHEILDNKSCNEEIIAISVGESDEYSEDGTILSSGIAFSSPKRYSKASSSLTKENCSSETNSSAALRLPCKKKQRLEEHTIDMGNRADMCYTESEEYRISASFAKDLFAISKQKSLTTENFSKENTFRELENREKSSESRTNLHYLTSIDQPLNFGNSSKHNRVKNIDTQRKENISKRNKKNEIKQVKRQGRRTTGTRKSKRSLTNTTENRRCCGKGAGKKCKGNARDAKSEENKEAKKKFVTILNDINRKKNVMKFKPLESHVDEKHAFRIHRIMYSTHLGEGLHSSHILNNVDPSNKGARMLALNIFCSKPTEEKNPALLANNLADQSKQDASVTKLPKSLQRSLALIRNLIHNYKKFNVHTCLKRYCPSSQDVKKLLQSYRLHKKRLVKDSSLRFDADKQKKLYDAAFNDNVPSYRVSLIYLTPLSSSFFYIFWCRIY